MGIGRHRSAKAENASPEVAPEGAEHAPVEDLEAREADAEGVRGGTTSNVMKTKHDTSKNSISNVR